MISRSIFRTICLVCLPVAFLALLAVDGRAQVYYAKEMTTEQYRTLDRSKTAVLLSVGILEEHGPYLPAYTDGYISERLVQDVSAAIVEKGWNALIFPIIPLGTGGANELGAKYPFPGTFVVRASTLRTLLMDYVSEIGDAGFRRIFLINNHGAPNHNRMLDQVCEYFNDSFAGGAMISLQGMRTSSSARIDEELQKMLSEAARKEDASSGHAGIGETSLMLFLQPKTVDPAYKSAPPVTAGFGDMIAVAKGENWPGYFGSPRFSTAAYGAKMYRSLSEQFVEQALKALEGSIPQAPRAGAGATGADRAKDNAALKRDEQIGKKQEEWLARKGYK